MNERVVGVQYTAWHYTAWHFVASVQASRPAASRALVWWGADDHTWSPKVPLFGSATAVHRTYEDGNCSARLQCRQDLGLPGDMMNFSWYVTFVTALLGLLACTETPTDLLGDRRESAFWVNSAVANLL